MKKYLSAFLFFFLTCGGALQAASLQQADDFYRQGHFASALGEYEELLRTYPNDPFLYYNIGNCYFKMGTKGLAVANYYRAFRLAPRDADIRHNLQLALQHSGERLVPAGMPVILHKAFFSLTLSELKGLCFVCIWAFCLITAFWCWKRRAGWAVWTLLACLLVSTGWYVGRLKLDTRPLAVVAAPVAELRSGPGTSFPASANVAQGHLVLLQDSRDKWQEVVILSQGIKGWLEDSVLEKI